MASDTLCFTSSNLVFNSLRVPSTPPNDASNVASTPTTIATGTAKPLNAAPKPLVAPPAALAEVPTALTPPANFSRFPAIAAMLLKFTSVPMNVRNPATPGATNSANLNNPIA